MLDEFNGTPTAAAPRAVAVLDAPGGEVATPLTSIDQPVVFRGLQDDWPARTRWTLYYFRRDYGEEPVRVREYEPGEDTDYTVTHTTLSDFLDYWEHTGPDPGLARHRRYLAEWNFVNDAPCLLDDFSVPEVFLPDLIDELPEQVRFGRTWLFFGEPGCSTGLHRDTFSTSAWLAMVSGRKLIRLVAPDVADHLEPGDSLWSPDTTTRLAGSAGATLLEVELDAGETLYIPSDWYHEVRNPERNLMVTANFVEPRSALPFLSHFEARLTEPLGPLRRLRNEHARSFYGEGVAPEGPYGPQFVRRQLAWVDEAIDPLLEYRALLARALAEPDLA